MAKFLTDSRVRLYGRAIAYLAAGFFLAAGSLFHACIPLASALVCGCAGMSGVLAALGGCLGYGVFWGSYGLQGIVWTGLALCICLFTGRLRQSSALLLPALASLSVSATGVLFQVWMGQEAPLQVYMLRVLLAGGGSWLFQRVLLKREPILRWLAGALGVLALAQVSITPWGNLGVFVAGAVTVTGAFPAAALAGVALDLSGITPVSMTAVLCAGYLTRFIPGYPRYLTGMTCGIAYVLVMNLGGELSLYPLPGLLAGGLVGVFLPLPGAAPARRGETGVAQVRLEMAAGAMLQTEQLLLEVRPVPVDEDGVLRRCVGEACGGCPCRGSCKDSRRISQLPGVILHKPLMNQEELPIVCRKSGRLLASLHRGQEQLRSIRADRLRQEEYRLAVIQQYRFLGEYLRQLSDQLARKAEPALPCYSISARVYGNRSKEENGDRWAAFAGVRDLQFVALCDGMGTGMGAVQEGRSAMLLLRRLLTAGYPAEAALRSLNSLCALRGRAGAVTVDLLEVSLTTGKCRLFKWGAAPSYRIGSLGAEKIGIASPPPGLSVTEQQEAEYRLSLSRGERLVMVSDGVAEEAALSLCTALKDAAGEMLARQLLATTEATGEDDATVVIIRLDPPT